MADRSVKRPLRVDEPVELPLRGEAVPVFLLRSRESLGFPSMESFSEAVGCTRTVLAAACSHGRLPRGDVLLRVAALLHQRGLLRLPGGGA